MKDSDLRVALVAPHASARFGGESILPLHYFRYLRRRGIDAWMVLHERTRAELTQLLGTDIERVWFIKDTVTDIWLHRLSTLLPARVGENTLVVLLKYSMQVRQKRLLRQLISEHHINLVHESSPVSPTQPSIMYGLGVPVVIGPLNGGMTFPRPFRHRQKWAERLFVNCARKLTPLVNWLLPGKRHATVLVANQRTAAALPVRPRKVIELPENGVDFTVFNKNLKADTQERNRIRLVYVGRLVDWKALDILIDILPRIKDLPFELHVLGDGPKKAALQQQAQRLGLEGKVAFHGFMPQGECARFLARSDILVLPSLYECGGAVVLEAMAMSLPVVASNWGGPADYLDEQSGILVDPSVSERHFRDDLEAALRYLITHPEQRQAVGRHAFERVRTRFSWDSKIDRIIDIYKQAIEEQGVALRHRPTRLHH